MNRTEFDALLEQQTERMLELLQTLERGNDELSALITCTIFGSIFTKMPEHRSVEKWIEFVDWYNDIERAGSRYLNPYSTSLDWAIQNENIVLLQRCEEDGLWEARQAGHLSVKARDRVLACRLAAFRSEVWNAASEPAELPELSEE